MPHAPAEADPMDTVALVRRRRRGRVVAALALLVASSAACTVSDDASGSDDDGVVADRLLDLAVGRWRCQGTADESQQDLLIAITRDGRLGFVALDDLTRFRPDAERELDVEKDPMPSGGTWKRTGLRLDLEIPWYGEGAHDFYRWRVTGDATSADDVPGKIAARPSGRDYERGGDDIDMRVEVDGDEVTLTQVRAPSGTISPNWRLTCDKLTSDPGTILPRQGPWTQDEGPPD
jgi:hypothetical protein